MARQSFARSAFHRMLEDMRDPKLKALDAVLAKKGYTRDGIAASSGLASYYNMQFSEVSLSLRRQKRENGVSRGVMENYSRNETPNGVMTTHYICLIPHPWDSDVDTTGVPKKDLLTVIYQKEEFKKGPKD